MIFNHRHISHASRSLSAVWQAVLAFAIAAVAPACSSAVGDEPVSPSVTGDYGFTLTLSVGDNESFMRSTPSDGEYDPGAGYENYIDLASPDYRIYLFNSNNKLIYAVPPVAVSLLPTDFSQEGSKTYELKFSLTDIQQYGFTNPDNCTFKMLMLANWRDYPAESSLTAGVTTIDDLMKSQQALRDFTAPKGALLTADERIPMFGVKLYSGISLDKDYMTQLDKFHLLRAYSKIEVFNSDNSITPIRSVVLTRHASKGYNAPLLPRYIQEEYVTNSYRNDYGAQSFRPAADYEISDDLELRRNPETGAFVIYVPEFANLTGGAVRPDNQRARLYITFDDGQQDYVEFKYYDDVNASRNGAKKGDFFDLRRNYWYRYELNKGTVTVSLRVDVVPYVEVNLNPSFGFDTPIVPDPNPVTPPWVDITDEEKDPSKS